MSVRIDDQMIRLEGRCRVEDAEPLLRALMTLSQATVDVSAATHLHSAVLQLILAARPTIIGVDPASFLARWLLPAGAVE